MNTPTPTPRTDMATYPADCLGTTLVTNRDCSRALERELVALTAERDQLRTDNSTLRAAQKACEACDEPTAFEVRQLRAEVERLNAIGSWSHTCIHHTDEERKAWAACPCCTNARAERAEAEAERYRLVTLKQDAKLATAKERLRSEAMDDYASIKDLQRELAAERARLDWLAESWDNPLAINLHPSYGWSAASKNLRAVIDAAMKEGAK